MDLIAIDEVTARLDALLAGHNAGSGPTTSACDS
jgi:hypothetical protein